jgi:hypothetical protein
MNYVMSLLTGSAPAGFHAIRLVCWSSDAILTDKAFEPFKQTGDVRHHE